MRSSFFSSIYTGPLIALVRINLNLAAEYKRCWEVGAVQRADRLPSLGWYLQCLILDLSEKKKEEREREIVMIYNLINYISQAQRAREDRDGKRKRERGEDELDSGGEKFTRGLETFGAVGAGVNKWPQIDYFEDPAASSAGRKSQDSKYFARSLHVI